MLKSTKMKIENERNANRIAAEANSIMREHNEIEQNHYENERLTKDRVDISLNEYNEMREKIKNLEKTVSSQKSLLDKILEPLLKSNLPPEIIEEIVVKHNYEKCEVKLLDFGFDDPLHTKIAVIYKIFRKER